MGENTNLYNPPMIQNQGYAAASNWQQYQLFKPLYTKQQLQTNYADKFNKWYNSSNLLNINYGKGNGLSARSSVSAEGNGGDNKQSFTDKFKNSGWGKGAGMAGQMLSQGYDSIPTMDEVHNSNDQLAADIRGTASKALLSSGNPYAMAAGAGLMILDKTGGFTDASEGLGGGNDFLNTVSAAALPFAGYFTGKTEKYNMSDILSSSSSYTGTAANGTTTMKNANAKILFGRSRANNMIREQQRKDFLAQDIIGEGKDRVRAASWEGNIFRNQTDLNGGMGRLHLAKYGTKLPSKKDLIKVRSILTHKFGGNLLPPKPEFYSILAYEEIQEFKEGGQLNVIPEGALHTRKHHMEDADNLTKKGIPVVDKDGEQQAEIERDEIIFRKEVTQKLEELMKDGSDKAAIEAGKLLVTEIFENTDDRTGLIMSIVGEDPLNEELLSKMQDGGSISKKYKYDTPWKFMKYLNSTGRGLDNDYDYESFYNDKDAYLNWESKEENNPGKAPMPSTYKRPSHITYSDEGYGWKESDKDGWTFTVSPRQQSLRSYDDYVNYWNKNEPSSTLIYNDKTYKVPK